MLATLTNQTPHRLTARIYTAPDGVQHNTRALESVWTDADLNQIGLYRVEYEAAPEGMIETGRALVFENGQVIDRPTVEPVPPEQVKETFRQAIQSHIDATAQSWNYDNGTALAGYVTSGVAEWQAEAQVFVAWRDQVWTVVFAALAAIEAGEAAPPESTQAFISGLPKINRPE